ncbi:MAG: outer membrane beta-barrel protein [Bacteroidetes bacterium]|nr:outer membrane beta-barrel protein [Bacteroidota bacterium]
MKKEEENISGFEYKPEYWQEAEALIVEEEKRRRALWWYSLVGVAATVVLVGSLFFTFSENEVQVDNKSLAKGTHNLNSTEVKNNFTEDQKQKQVHSPKENVQANKPVNVSVRAHEEKTVKKEIENSASAVILVEENRSIEMSLVENSVGVEASVLTDTSMLTAPIVATGKEIDKSIVVEDMQLASTPLKLKGNFLSNVEIYTSVMATPSYSLQALGGGGHNTISASANVGAMVAKDLNAGWSLAAGLQYNAYTSLCRSERIKAYATSNVDTVVQYNTVANNQKWVPLVISGNTSTFLVSTSTVAAADTVNFDVVSAKNTVTGSRSLSTKDIITGSIVVPIELRYRYKRLRVAAGMSLEYIFHNVVKSENTIEFNGYLSSKQSESKFNDFYNYNRLWCNATFGLDYLINSSFSVGIRGAYGLSDVINYHSPVSTAGDPYIATTTSYGVSAYNMALTLRYQLPLLRKIGG